VNVQENNEPILGLILHAMIGL